MNKEETVVEGEYTITDVSTTTLGTIVGAEIDVQIATAKQYPRSLAAFKKRALSLATVSQEVAEACEYGLPRGNKIIRGPSVRLAEIVGSSYGNLRIGARVVNNNGRTITSQGICHDLETNVCITIEVSRSIMQHEMKWSEAAKKMVRTGRMVQMNEDMQTMAGNAASSIALRNAVFKVIPKAAWNDVYEQTKVIAKGDAATLVTRRDAALKYFKDKGIREEQIFQRLEVGGLEDIDLDKLSILSAMKAAIHNNEASLENLFPPPDAAAKAKAATDKTEDKLKGAAKGQKGAVQTAADLEKDLASKEKPA